MMIMRGVYPAVCAGIVKKRVLPAVAGSPATLPGMGGWSLRPSACGYIARACCRLPGRDACAQSILASEPGGTSGSTSGTQDGFMARRILPIPDFMPAEAWYICVRAGAGIQSPAHIAAIWPHRTALRQYYCIIGNPILRERPFRKDAQRRSAGSTDHLPGWRHLTSAAIPHCTGK